MKRVLPVLLVVLFSSLLAVIAWFAGRPSVGVNVAQDASADNAVADSEPLKSPPNPLPANTHSEVSLPATIDEPAPPVKHTPVQPVADAVSPQPEQAAESDEHTIRVQVLSPYNVAVRATGIVMQVVQGPEQKRMWREKLYERNITSVGPYVFRCPSSLLELENARLEVFVGSKGYADTLVDVAFPTDEVEIRLVTPAFLIVDVPNADTYADTRVSWRLRSGRNYFYRAEDSPSRALDDGARRYASPYRSRLVVPGHYVLEVYRAASRRGGRGPGGWGDLVLASYELELKPGRNDFSVRFPDLSKLTVRSDIPPAPTLRLYSNTRNVELPCEAKEDRYEFWHVPAGDWVLYDNLGRQAVHVEGDTELKFEPTNADCFHVDGTEDNAPLHAAGFQAGDLVTEVDGRDLSDIRASGEWTQDATNTTWTVLRNGDSLKVTFNLRALNKEMKRTDFDWPFVPWRREGWPDELQLPETAISK